MWVGMAGRGCWEAKHVQSPIAIVEKPDTEKGGRALVADDKGDKGKIL